MVIWASYSLRLSDLGRGKAILWFLVSILFWTLLQLVPLPPAAWQSLPERDIIAKLDQLAGHADLWRPLSLAPHGGLDSAFAMIAPIAALLLASSMRVTARALLLAIVALGLLDATLGILQFLGGSSSPFYFFSGASPGAVEGIFGNENHSAVFSALVLLVIARLALEDGFWANPWWQKSALAPAFLVILLAVLVSGSRAGLLSTLIALLASAVMWTLASRRHDGPSTNSAVGRSSKARRRASIIGFAAAIVMVVLAFIWLERTPAASDLVEGNAFDDLRWSLWPVLREMAATHWLFGTGFGSFEAVYRVYEPTDLLLPAYVNHAHNDWLQLLIEGGLPATLILCSFIVWGIRAVWFVGVGPGARPERCVFWVACLTIIAAASIVDYPLRTPLFQATFVWLMLCLCSDRDAGSRSRKVDDTRQVA